MKIYVAAGLLLGSAVAFDSKNKTATEKDSKDDEPKMTIFEELELKLDDCPEGKDGFPCWPSKFPDLDPNNPGVIPNFQIFKPDGKGGRTPLPNLEGIYEAFKTGDPDSTDDKFGKLCDSPAPDGTCWIWADPLQNCANACKQFAIDMKMKEKGPSQCYRQRLADTVTTAEFELAGARANNNTGDDILPSVGCVGGVMLADEDQVPVTPFYSTDMNDEGCFTRNATAFDGHSTDCFSVPEDEDEIRLCPCTYLCDYDPVNKNKVDSPTGIESKCDVETFILKRGVKPTTPKKDKKGIFDLGSLGDYFSFNYDDKEDKDE
uniref:Uncharacterized protein n=1 Tax=Chromera velia CCMP2878 TaxID=1169474 RepID=A0A0G4IDD8_9ALVE|mmetsp:Transcript_15026/g.30374  ORF Transcript_15026/g.30374 Transcript_15026/m.30374 type:complete len:319 (+) Transcript_15026:160-1116(+)|eukprot:Cvel_13330.t1-p1 / transcript=Cvel_13330.t1 / gene=Cvel_13330 / organism=Chromera_velia_CCMP2878 / gene_product=hypothetical protein / transcript_product=hypothetical protein / location=Cvel_scaffold905:37898-40486(+) / protein_length=318 / sequence_SO=supercontig / SO=protein_coding / is_pseudo=false